MTLQERLSVGLFVAAVGVVYYLEGRLILAWAIARARRREGAPRMLRAQAIVLHALAAGGLLCLAYGHLIEPYRMEVKRVPISTGKLRAARIRIVQISDLHCDRKAGNEERLVETVKALRPDVIVFTGDAANRPGAVGRFRDAMRGLEAPLGKFAVRGNFDLRLGQDLFDGTGFRELEGETVRIEAQGDTFCLTGLTCARDDCTDLLGRVPEDGYSIFVYHYPDIAEEAAQAGADLYLCGHTHGGQVALPLYGALVTLSRHGKKYERGLYTVGDMLMYVNHGIGMEPAPAPRVRFLSRPEVTVFDIAPGTR